MKKVTNEFLVNLYEEINKAGSFYLCKKSLIDITPPEINLFTNTMEDWEDKLDWVFEDLIKVLSEPEYQITCISSSLLTYTPPSPTFTGYRFFFKSGVEHIEIIPIEKK